MKISPIQNIRYNGQNYSSQSKNSTKIESLPNFDLKNFQIPFYGLPPAKNNQLTEADFKKAKEYLNWRCDSAEGQSKLSDFNLNKLNGIQKGIEVFEGLSMKDIAFLYTNLLEIAINRGCSNGCSDCYVKAIPQQHFEENSDTISKMAYEDFNSLMNGVGELNQRLGFKALKRNDVGHISLFRDSDGIELEMKDENGKIYDFTEANDLYYKTINQKGLFDTSGWPPRHKKYQARAEKIVNYFSKEENANKVININISINPFHSLNEKSIQLKNIGDKKGAQKFRELYTDRMANVLYTFTPIIDSPKFRFMPTSMSDDKITPKGYKKSDLEKLIKEILSKLKDKYIKDYKSEKKYIKEPEQIRSNMKILQNKLVKKGLIVRSGRGRNLLPETADFVQARNEAFIERLKNNFINVDCYKSIDINGKVYVTNFYSVVPTEIQLNFKNRNKSTIPMEEMIDKIKVTKRMIEMVF